MYLAALIGCVELQKYCKSWDTLVAQLLLEDFPSINLHHPAHLQQDKVILPARDNAECSLCELL
jgi:hypothetical protein